MPIQRKAYPFTPEGFNFATEKAGVYELLNSRKNVVYIGSSKTSIKSRLLTHKKEAKFKNAKYFRSMPITPAYNAEGKECDLIRTYLKTHNGNRPPLLERSPKRRVIKNLLDEWVREIQHS